MNEIGCNAYGAIDAYTCNYKRNLTDINYTITITPAKGMSITIKLRLLGTV